MTTLWERFDAALGDLRVTASDGSVAQKEYQICGQGGPYNVSVEQLHRDVLRLTRYDPSCDTSRTDMLAANAASRYWGFAVAGGRVTVQADIFAEDLEVTREIMADLSAPLTCVKGGKQCRAPHPDGIEDKDPRRMQRLRCALESEVIKFAAQDDGSLTAEIVVTRRSAPYRLQCNTVPGPMVELRSQVSETPIHSESLRHYLLDRSTEFTGCRAAIDHEGHPMLIAFVPFCAIELGGFGRRSEMFLQGLHELRNLSFLHDPVVSRLYHAFNVH